MVASASRLTPQKEGRAASSGPPTMPARVEPAYMSTLASAETVPRAEVVRAWSRFIMTGKSTPPTVKAPASRATPTQRVGLAATTA